MCALHMAFEVHACLRQDLHFFGLGAHCNLDVRFVLLTAHLVLQLVLHHLHVCVESVDLLFTVFVEHFFYEGTTLTFTTSRSGPRHYFVEIINFSILKLQLLVHDACL